MDKKIEEELGFNEQAWSSKIKGALALRDYAITNNLYVPDDILRSLQEADSKDIMRIESSDIRFNIDKAIRDLTSITFPTTIDTLRFQGSKEGLRVIHKFRIYLTLLGLLALFVAIAAFGLTKLDPNKMGNWAAWGSPIKHIGLALLGISLGLLGAIVYVIFNLIGEWTEKVMSAEDPAEAYLRILLGPIVGWVFFFAFAQAAFQKSDSNNALLLLPFLAGVSTKLVVGIITQSIQAIQITLGLEDKASRILARKSRSKQKGP